MYWCTSCLAHHRMRRTQCELRWTVLATQIEYACIYLWTGLDITPLPIAHCPFHSINSLEQKKTISMIYSTFTFDFMDAEADADAEADIGTLKYALESVLESNKKKLLEQ